MAIRNKTALAALMLSIASTGVWADASFPSRPITIVVPFTAGGPTDAAARIVARSIEKSAGQPVIIENIGGAGSTIGAARVATAQPDGYKLLWATSSAMAIAPHLYPNVGYDAFKSFVPIGMVASSPFILMVNASSAIKSYADLVETARANPAKLNYGTPGPGTIQHLTIALLEQKSQFKATHVPFRGGAPAMTALIGQQIDFLVDTPAAALPMITAGKVRAIAVTGDAQLPELPSAPTLDKLGLKDVVSTSWYAMYAPHDVPSDVLAKLRGYLKTALEQPETQAVLHQTGFTITSKGADELVTLMRSENAKWQKIVADGKIGLN